MLKHGCILSNLTNICLQKSTDSKIHLLTETNIDLLEKTKKDMVGGTFIVFALKLLMYEVLIQKSTSLCKSIVGIDASQLYPYSMCQPMPTGL